jgi:hypothetical protein
MNGYSANGKKKIVFNNRESIKMEHDYYKEFMSYYTPAGTPEYTVDKVLTTDEMLEYTLNTLNRFLSPTVNSEETDC